MKRDAVFGSFAAILAAGYDSGLCLNPTEARSLAPALVALAETIEEVTS